MSKAKVSLLPIVVVLVVVLAGCESTTGTVNSVFRSVLSAWPMNDAQLTSIYSKDPTLSIAWVDGESGSLRFRKNGTVTLDHQGRTYDGMWRVAGYRFCTRFGDGREERCFHQYRQGRKKIVWYDAFTGSRHGTTEAP